MENDEYHFVSPGPRFYVSDLEKETKNVFRTKSATYDPIGAVESKSLKVQESLNKSQGNGK